MDEESGDEAEGVEADTTMTLQGGVSKAFTQSTVISFMCFA